jgi:hypothetical protein
LQTKTFAPEHFLALLPGETIGLSALIGDVPLGWQGRHYFSLATLKSLRPDGTANFTLLLEHSDAAFLIGELRRAGFKTWSAIEEKLGKLAKITFEIDFASSDNLDAISIVIPFYNNSQAEITRAISSVSKALEAGAFKSESEIVIVDDGSIRTVESVMISLKKLFPTLTIRVLRNRNNRGVARARNRGLKEAKHETVFFLDADDEIHPLYLRSLSLQIKAGADVAACDMQISDLEELICARSTGAPEVFSRNSFGSGIAINRGTKTVASLLKLQPLYNPLFWKCYEDWELNCTLWLAGAKIALVPAPFYIYHRKLVGRDADARKYHPYFKRLLPYSAMVRSWLARICK